MTAEKLIEAQLEKWYQESEGSCCICHQADYPVKGDKSGYDEVTSEEAEQWSIDHAEGCAVLVLEKALAALAAEQEEKEKLEKWQIKPSEAICLTDLACRYKKVFKND